MSKKLILFQEDKISNEEKFYILMDLLVSNQGESSLEFYIFFGIFYLQIISSFFSDFVGILNINDSFSDYQQSKMNSYLDNLLSEKYDRFSKKNEFVDKKKTKDYLDSCIVFLYDKRNKNIKSFLNEILKEFEEVGYTIVYKIVNAFEYGVPQSRERVILVGVRSDLRRQFEFKKPPYGMVDSSGQMNLFGTTLPIRTFRDAMEGLETLENLIR